jgi:UDP:flavonoid glycosyltransferase YjiC (YdhE family)
VTLQTWTRWRDHVEAEGMRFAAAPEYHVFPTRERPLTPYEAVERATRDTAGLVRHVAPDAVVSDILTLAPALAGELEGVRVATVIPHVDPRVPAGGAPYSCGARVPRTAAGRALWRCADPLMRRGLALGRDELNETRGRLGLPALERFHAGISDALCLVATFPQLEYSRAWPPRTHIVGPLLWEPPADDVELPQGDEPLVLVAPSTSHDAAGRLLRATLDGLAGLPVRVLASANRPGGDMPVEIPPNARLVQWASYARTMPACELVVCHGGHGTVVRALASGCALVVVPAAGDMNENAARIDWAGVGVRLPRRMASARPLALAVGRALARPCLRARARELAAWAAANDGAARGAELVEEFASEGRGGPNGRGAR